MRGTVDQGFVEKENRGDKGDYAGRMTIWDNRGWIVDEGNGTMPEVRRKVGKEEWRAD